MKGRERESSRDKRKKNRLSPSKKKLLSILTRKKGDYLAGSPIQKKNDLGKNPFLSQKTYQQLSLPPGKREIEGGKKGGDRLSSLFKRRGPLVQNANHLKSYEGGVSTLKKRTSFSEKKAC